MVLFPIELNARRDYRHSNSSATNLAPKIILEKTSFLFMCPLLLTPNVVNKWRTYPLNFLVST